MRRKTLLLRHILKTPNKPAVFKTQIMFLKRKVAIFLFLLMFFYVFSAEAAVNINIVAANASATENKKSPIKYYLPKELAPEDVISTGGLNLDYDIDQSSYYLYGSIELAPKESKTIKVEVQDVWRISADEVDILKKQIDDNISLLAKTPYLESSQILRDNMVRKLDYILAQQNNYSDNIERRIEEYRAYLKDINEIRRNAFTSEYFKTAVLHAEAAKTVKFVIEVENSSKTQEKKFQQQHYLPTEVRAEDVVEAQGFDVRFDDAKQRAYLAKEETFAPAEKKRYEIMIKDIWNISQDQIDNFRDRSERAIDGIKGNPLQVFGARVGNGP